MEQEDAGEEEEGGRHYLVLCLVDCSIRAMTNWFQQVVIAPNGLAHSAKYVLIILYVWQRSAGRQGVCGGGPSGEEEEMK